MRRLRLLRLPILTKLLLAFAIVCTLIGYSALYATARLTDVDLQYQDVTLRLQPASNSAAGVEVGVYRQVAAVRGYLLDQSPDMVAQYMNAHRDTAGHIEDLLARSTDAEQQAMAADLAELSQAYDASVQQVFALIREGRLPAAEQVHTTEGAPILTQMVRISTELSRQFAQEAGDAAVQANAAAERSRTISYVLLAVGVVYSLVAGVALARLIAKPLTAAAAVVRELARGNLQVTRIGITTQKTRDEVSDLAEALDAMVVNLRALVSDVTAGARDLLASSKQLAAAADQAAQSAQRVDQAVVEVATGTNEQVSTTDLVARSISELQQAIQQIAAGATASASEVNQASDLLNQMVDSLEAMAGDAAGVAAGARQVAESSDQGHAVVKQTVDGMERIRDSVSLTADRIRQLERLSTQIGDITETISGIADQTNLLALNAAIEAARAGNHGRGFAVVAEEVRKLAERSANSTQEIAGIITNIQTQTDAAVKAMEQGIAEVESGSRAAVAAGQSLQVIKETADNAAKDVTGVAAAADQVRQNAGTVVKAFSSVAAVTEENTASTEQMAASAGEMAASTERITRVAQENAAATEAVSASIEQLTAAAEQVAASAQNLARIAQELQGQVSRFQV